MHKQFSLTLGGGAARGLAHIGVIERLDELGIKPAEISGTSIGAIIGALYAAGYSGKEMRAIALETKILQLVDLDLKNGLIKGNKVQKYLSKYLGEKTFADIHIPLSIISTNIDTGEKVIFREGRLIDAIRASISIPGVFIPYKHDGLHLVDGGITENLPIEAIRNTHPVIAVSVLMDVKKRVWKKKSFLFPNGTIFSNGYDVIRKMVSIMMIQNELRSIGMREPALMIRPERYDIDYYNFNKMDLMINEGYRSAEVLNDFFNY